MSDGVPVQLYKPRTAVYPRSVKGRYRYLKYSVLALAYGVYFLLPWLRWERLSEVDQAVLFDIEHRRFYLFDLIVDASDIFWLAGILVIAAMLLFFVTGMAGRVFCGYFCFQTLWTDVFVLVERLIQGERPARLRLAKAPWNLEKVRKLGITWALWLLIGFLTGLTFTLYWGDAPTLVSQFFVGAAPFAAYATTLFLTATTFVFAGLAREQVCTYMCPYARFQSVMFDRDTLIIAYDRPRGENSAGRHKTSRGYRSREERTEKGAGDCVDCGYCVQVCPTGIDIRNGLQLECISCGLCVDACNSIMDKLEWPRGLIRYTSEAMLEGGKPRFLKPKSVGYGVALIAALAMLGTSVANQDPFAVTISQIRQPLAVRLSDGRIQNGYEIKLNNKLMEPVRFHIRTERLPDSELDLGKFEEIRVGPGQRLRVLAHVRREPSGDLDKRTFDFVVTRLTGEQREVRRSANFHQP